MISKYRCSIKTSPVSVRIDSDILKEFRSKNLNLSSTVNRLLRAYLYIQSCDDSIRFDRLNAKVSSEVDITVDIYSSISDV